jgi:AcrR family transcriptional regulator
VPRAGLGAAAVTACAATLADEVGLQTLSMGAVAGRLGVKTPSLYKHVDGLADLTHRIALLGMGELGEAVREATQGRSGRDALLAAARAMRRFVLDHPGRYAATIDARTAGPEDPFTAISEQTLRSFGAVLHGYHLGPDDEVHALRTVRSVLHGFVTLEAAGGFRYATEVDASFTWLVDLVDQGLRVAGSRAGVKQDDLR